MSRKPNNYETERLTFQIPKDQELKKELQTLIKPIIKRKVKAYKKENNL